MENPFRTGEHVINVNPDSMDYGMHGVIYSIRGDIILVTLDNSTGAIQFHFTHFASLEA